MRSTTSCLIVIVLLIVGCQQKQTPHPGSNASAGTVVQPSASESAAPDQMSAAAERPKADAESPNVVALDAFQLTAPASWPRKPVSSQFVLAEFALPRAAGDELDGRVTVSTAGGGVEANINRWKGQFQPEPKSASQEQIEIAGVKATLVDLAGDFNDQRGPFAPGELRKSYRMIATILPVAGQLYFIKATGPEKTIAANAEAIHAFITSAKTNK